MPVALGPFRQLAALGSGLASFSADRPYVIDGPRQRALWGAGWLGMVMGTLAQSREYFEEGTLHMRRVERKMPLV